MTFTGVPPMAVDVVISMHVPQSTGQNNWNDDFAAGGPRVHWLALKVLHSSGSLSPLQSHVCCHVLTRALLLTSYIHQRFSSESEVVLPYVFVS